MARKSGLSIEETLTALMEAGLDSIPGGGAEILVDEVRRKISPNKCSAEPVARCHANALTDWA